MEAVSRQHWDADNEQRDIVDEWYRCRGYIVSALEHCETHDIWDIEAAIAEGYMQFWPGKKAAMVTQVHHFPKVRYLDIFLCGGDVNELLEMEQAVCEHAKLWNCQKVTGGGRKGWARFLAKHGYKPLTVLEKDVSNG